MSINFAIYRKITDTENKNKLKFIALFSTTLSAVYRATVWATHFAWPRFDSVIPRIEIGEFNSILKENVTSGHSMKAKGKNRGFC